MALLARGPRRKGDGTEFWVSGSGRAIMFQGEPALLSCYLDITKRKQAEERIRLQALLLDSVRESVVATDLDGRVIFWNKGAEQLYGYTASEVMGKPVPESADTGSAEEEGRVSEVQRHGMWSGQHGQRRRDGSTFWSHSVVSLMHEVDGAPCGLVSRTG